MKGIGQGLKEFKKAKDTDNTDVKKDIGETK
jgi:Sec-independent protein translocase protein TatA